MKLVFFWTDYLVFVLIISIILFMIQIRKTSHLTLIKHKVRSKKRYIISFFVLMIFSGIAFLDTLHFKEASSYRTISVLDKILSPFDTITESTYSAPLARKSFVPEITLQPDGRLTENFPELNYPAKHLFGTDKVGQDVLYMVLKSIRTGLIIGTITTLIMLPFALLFGMWAGYFRGWVDDIIQYIYTTLSSVPGVLLIAAAIVSLQAKVEENPDLRLIILCIILGVTSWTTLCRLIRGETLKLREAEFVQAAIVLGVRPFNLIRRHILPNLMHIVIITVILDFSTLVLAEAVLSYVGVGVDPTTFSFGNMINAARLEMARDPIIWWPLTFAFIFMFALVFAANIFSEALQEALNPRMAR